MFTNKTNKEISSIMFAMYDDKPYEQIIWKMLRQKHAKAFKEEI